MKFTKVILIDDDTVTNFLNTEILSMYDPALTIQSFSDPGKAIDYLLAQQEHISKEPVLLFLDINMPLISGWELLEQLKLTKPDLLSGIQTYLLTSSIDENDQQRAKENIHITAILHKPLHEEMLDKIFTE